MASEAPLPGQPGHAPQLDAARRPDGGGPAPERHRRLSLLYAGGTHSFPDVAPEKVALLLDLLQDGEGVEVDPNDVSPAEYRRIHLHRYMDKQRESVMEQHRQARKRSASPPGSTESGGEAAAGAPAMSRHLSEPLPAELPDLAHSRLGAGAGPSGRLGSAWRCGNCDARDAETPMRRRGPDGPGTLCNACGLMYSSKGVLRALEDHTPAAEPQDEELDNQVAMHGGASSTRVLSLSCGFASAADAQPRSSQPPDLQLLPPVVQHLQPQLPPQQQQQQQQQQSPPQPPLADWVAAVSGEDCAGLRRMSTSWPLAVDTSAIRSLVSLLLPSGPAGAGGVTAAALASVSGASSTVPAALHPSALGIELRLIAAGGPGFAPASMHPQAPVSTYVSPFAHQQQRLSPPQMLPAAPASGASCVPLPQLQPDPQPQWRRQSWPLHAVSSPDAAHPAQAAAAMLPDIGASPWSRLSDPLPAASGGPFAAPPPTPARDLQLQSAPAQAAQDAATADEEDSFGALGFDFSWAIGDVPAPAGGPAAAPAELTRAAEELVPLSRDSIESLLGCFGSEELPPPHQAPKACGDIPASQDGRVPQPMSAATRMVPGFPASSTVSRKGRPPHYHVAWAHCACVQHSISAASVAFEPSTPTAMLLQRCCTLDFRHAHGSGAACRRSDMGHDSCMAGTSMHPEACTL